MFWFILWCAFSIKIYTILYERNTGVDLGVNPKLFSEGRGIGVQRWRMHGQFSIIGGARNRLPPPNVYAYG